MMPYIFPTCTATSCARTGYSVRRRDRRLTSPSRRPASNAEVGEVRRRHHILFALPARPSCSSSTLVVGVRTGLLPPRRPTLRRGLLSSPSLHDRYCYHWLLFFTTDFALRRTRCSISALCGDDTCSFTFLCFSRLAAALVHRDGATLHVWLD